MQGHFGNSPFPDTLERVGISGYYYSDTSWMGHFSDVIRKVSSLHYLKCHAYLKSSYVISALLCVTLDGQIMLLNKYG